jgi:hypothetical protein
VGGPGRAAVHPVRAGEGGQVLIVVYSYFAYSFRRYTHGMGKISGTGLVTPTWTGS